MGRGEIFYFTMPTLVTDYVEFVMVLGRGSNFVASSAHEEMLFRDLSMKIS